MSAPDRNDVLRAALASLEAGRFAEAARAVEPIYLADTRDPEVMLLLGLAVGGCGHPDLAADLLDEVARHAPAAAHPANDLLRLLAQAGRQDAADAYLDAALALAPHDPRLLTVAASSHLDRGDNGRAEALLAQAVRLNPALPGAQIGLATVEAERGALAAAERRLRDLIARGGASATASGNLGAMLGVQGRFTEAIPLLAHATAAQPGHAQLAVNHGMALLKAGRLAEGWPLFNRRLDLPGHALLPPDRLLPALAPGQRLDGTRVLVTHDSGFGDTLQFARYLPMLADRGAEVVLWVPDPLRRLLATVPGVSRIMADREPWPSHDWHCPVIRLAEVFGTTLDTIPAGVPYLGADPGGVAAWSPRLPEGPRRVGLVWAGSARHGTARLAAVDRRRSIDPALLAPLLRVPGVRWVSLQMGQPAPPFAIADPMAGVRDFADTAAIVAQLDAVVSVDTAVAHLAGAMGVPVLLLDRYDSCWRWLSSRTDSPWYPTLRVFRQDAWGAWDRPVEAVAAALAAWDVPTPTPAPAGPRSA